MTLAFGLQGRSLRDSRLAVDARRQVDRLRAPDIQVAVVRQPPRIYGEAAGITTTASDQLQADR